MNSALGESQAANKRIDLQFSTEINSGSSHQHKNKAQALFETVYNTSNEHTHTRLFFADKKF